MIRHFVTDRRRAGIDLDTLVDRARRAARGGVDVVQVRERDLPDAELAALVRRMVRALSGTGTRVLVNDRADVALVAGAAGVHLRGDAPPASRIRAIVPRAFVIGRSVHSLSEIDRALADGACDYLMFGTVFRSLGKPADHPVAGLEGLREACRRSSLPVIAIGGITEERDAQVADAGASGVAAVGRFM